MPTEQLVISISEKGALVVKRNLQSVGTSSATAAKGVHLLKGALAALGVASAALVTISTVKMLAKFSQNMSTVQAITAATTDEFKALRDTAKELGETTRFTASQAAEAMVNLSRAGFTASETIETVDDTLRLAQSGALDLADAARITTQVLRGFRLETDQAQRVTDVLAMAANSANTDVAMLGEGLKFVAPIARGLNVGLEETVAVLQSLADAGLRSTLGGTGLRMMLAKLESPTGRAKEVLKELKLEESDLSVETHGLTKVLRTLSARGLGTSQALKLFGTRAGAAGTVAVAMADALVDMTDALRDAEGYGKTTADIMDDNLNGALLRAKSAIEAVLIEIGDLGNEAGLTKFLNDFAEGTRWVAHNMETLDKAIKILATTMTVIFLPQISMAFAAGMNMMVVGVQKLYAAILAHPFVFWAAIITAALAALYHFRNEIKVFGEDFVTLGDIMSSAVDVITSSFSSLKGDVKSDMDDIQDDSSDTMQTVVTMGLAVLQTVLQVIDKLVGSISGIFNGIYRATSLVIRKIKGDDVSWQEIGMGFSEEVIAGMTSSNLEDKLLAIIDGATDKALQRQKDAVAKLKAEGKKEKEEVKDPPALTVTTEEGRDFDAIIASLRTENELLTMNTRAREAQAVILDVETELKRELTTEEAALVASLIRENQQLQVQSDLLEQIRGPQDAFNQGKAALQALLDKGSISLDEYNKKLKELSATLEQAMRESGLKEALGASLFDNAAHALDAFIGGAKVQFSEFAHSVLRDIASITGKLLMLQAFKALGVPGLPAFATGGSFMVGGSGGTDSQVVAFRASPGERVDVSTAGQQQAAAAGVGATSGEPRVTIINDIDPQFALDAVGSAAGGKVVTNLIRKNKGTIRKILGS